MFRGHSQVVSQVECLYKLHAEHNYRTLYSCKIVMLTLLTSVKVGMVYNLSSEVVIIINNSGIC